MWNESNEHFWMHDLSDDNRRKPNFVGQIDRWKCLKSKSLFYSQQTGFHVNDQFSFQPPV